MLLYKRRILFLLIWLFCLDNYGCTSDEGPVSLLFLKFSKTCISESSKSFSWSLTSLVSSVTVCFCFFVAGDTIAVTSFAVHFPVVAASLLC
jgi:hypothetical protein